MVDVLNQNGIQIKSLNEILTNLENGLKTIYGDDINLEQNSPDGQLVNIISQSIIDIKELIVDVYNSFNPDTASGRVLDERVAINNITRKGGTYTITNVDVTVDRTVSLQGLDEDFNNPDGTGYTVQDDSGNEFILIDSVTIEAGTHSLGFRAKDIGEVSTTIGTIINPVTVVLGVVDIENTSGALQVGEDLETDAQLRVRRASSTANGSNGYLNGLLGVVLELDGVTDGKVFENVTNVEDANGIPAHGIWLIVEGGSIADIANKIYDKKSYGANMKGDVTYDIDTPSGGVFTAKFDRPTPEDLYIRFDLKPTREDVIFDLEAIKQSIVDKLSYSIGQFAETSKITVLALEAINDNGGNGVPINVEISIDNMTWEDYLETSNLDSKFVIDVANIDITEV